jgi:hypothetical protein
MALAQKLAEYLQVQRTKDTRADNADPWCHLSSSPLF